MAPEDHSGPGLRYVVHWREKQASVESDTRWNQVGIKFSFFLEHFVAFRMF